MSGKTHKGRCSCGRIHFELRRKPLIVHGCHCRLCQNQTGGTNAVNILIEAGNLSLLSGEIYQHTLDTPSGHGQVVTRCKHCYVAVWSEYLIFSAKCGAQIHFVRAGTMDQPEVFPPDVHIFTSTRQPHALLAEGAPAFGAFYPIQSTWSRESLQRLKELA